MKEVLAIIPAKSNSKLIINKNIIPICGKPLIEYTIEVARRCKIINRLIVSTDSQKIADISKSLNAEVPFLRPLHLAEDNTRGIDPIIHAVEWLEKNMNYVPDYVLCLQPTSPFRTDKDIESAYELAQKVNADSVISVCKTKQHPYWMKQINNDGKMSDFIKINNPISRRQDLPEIYILNGSIYLAKRKLLIEKKTWYSENTYAYIMPIERSIDIDEPWDLYLTESILLRNKINVESNQS